MTIDTLVYKFREHKGQKPPLPDDLAKEQEELNAILTRLKNEVPSADQKPETAESQNTPQA